MDQKTGDSVVSLIRKIAKEKKKTVLLVTHDHELECYADRVIRLRSGQIIADEIDSLLTNNTEGIVSNGATNI